MRNGVAEAHVRVRDEPREAHPIGRCSFAPPPDLRHPRRVLVLNSFDRLRARVRTPPRHPIGAARPCVAWAHGRASQRG